MGPRIKFLWNVMYFICYNILCKEMNPNVEQAYGMEVQDGKERRNSQENQ